MTFALFYHRIGLLQDSVIIYLAENSSYKIYNCSHRYNLKKGSVFFIFFITFNIIDHIQESL